MYDRKIFNIRVVLHTCLNISLVKHTSHIMGLGELSLLNFVHICLYIYIHILFTAYDRFQEHPFDHTCQFA